MSLHPHLQAVWHLVSCLPASVRWCSMFAPWMVEYPEVLVALHWKRLHCHGDFGSQSLPPLSILKWKCMHWYMFFLWLNLKRHIKVLLAYRNNMLTLNFSFCFGNVIHPLFHSWLAGFVSKRWLEKEVGKWKMGCDL